MLWTAILLQLALWVTSIHAFFPWFPDEHVEGVSKKDSRRANVDGPSVRFRDAPRSGLSFRLEQRKSNSDQPRNVHVAQAADRLTRKYAPAGVSRTSESSSTLDKRGNQFKVISAATPQQSNSAGIHQDGSDISYFIQVGFGSDETPLYMLVDSGAGTTWVMGEKCSTKACTMHNLFGQGDSKTLDVTTDTFSISYGSGKVEGNLAQDTLHIAGMNASMRFGVADTTSSDFEHFPFDGILGLSMAKGATDNFLDMVKKEKLLGANIFAMSLNRNADGNNDGEITFGATNSAKYTGDISYTPVSDSAHGDWAISLDDIEYDGKKVGVAGRLAYIDTGTSYVFGPESDVAALHKQIPGAKSKDGVSYTAPCDSKVPVTVVFGGKKYAISPKDWLAAPNGNGECNSNIYGHEVVKGQWLLGDLFLKNVYTVFDVDQSRIGFAAKPASSTPTSSSAAPSSTPGPTKSGSSTSKSEDASTSSADESSKDSTAATTVTTAAPSGSTAAAQVPGLSGHETSATAVADSSAPAATPTQNLAGEQFESNRYVTMICVVAAIVLAA